MTRLNPNPHEQGFSAKPLNGVAGTIDRLKDAVEAVEDLKAAISRKVTSRFLSALTALPDSNPRVSFMGCSAKLLGRVNGSEARMLPTRMPKNPLSPAECGLPHKLMEPKLASILPLPSLSGEAPITCASSARLR